MKIAIWLHELFDPAGALLTGGVQTYVRELAALFAGEGHEVVVLAPRLVASTVSTIGWVLEAVPPAEWRRGTGGTTAKRHSLDDPDCIHVVANAHGSPTRLGPRTVGIQHGIYWDRPAHRYPWLRRTVPGLMNAIRSKRGVDAIRRFRNLVCVDCSFPTMAACLASPIPWSRLFYIPNFAPDSHAAPRISAQIRRLVFCRRIEVVRGSRLFCDLAQEAIHRGWCRQIDVIGNGPDLEYMTSKLGQYNCVNFAELETGRRMDAFSEDSLVVLPSLSTEGTAFTCIEAWSRGSLVMCSAVGGLANLVLDNVNGLLVRPILQDLTTRLRELMSGRYDIQRLKRAGYETYLYGFTHSRWARRWLAVLEGLDSERVFEPSP